MIDKLSPGEDWIRSLRERFPTERLVDEALTRKLYNRLTKPGGHKMQSLQDVEERLRHFFAGHLSDGFAISDIKSLTGGSSKEQYRFRLRWDDPDAGALSQVFVLRLQPTESIVETHRAREAGILRALHPHLAVPDAPWSDIEGTVFGQPALIMQFVPGLVKPPADGLGEVTGPKQGFGPHYRRLIAPHFLQMIADIHRLDWSSLDMAVFDLPRAGTTEAVIWHINWWRRVWEEDSIAPMPLMTLVANWLVQNAPPVDHVSIIHGDMRGGNFLFEEKSGRIEAMLDWELVHLGDRHEDLAYIMQDVFSSLDEDGQVLVNGFWRKDDFLAEYERLSGLPVDPARLDYYRVLVAYRSAVITLATGNRAAMGGKSHQDILLMWIAGTGVVTLQDMVDGMKRSV